MALSPSSSSSGGAAGAITRAFDKTLTVAAATIDTGANAIAADASHLLVVCRLRCDEAVPRDASTVTFNGDTAAHYVAEQNRGLNASGATSAITSASALQADTAGASATAGFFSPTVFWLTSYTDATAAKSGVLNDATLSLLAAGTNNWASLKGFLWTGTAAVNQITVTCPPAATVLTVGSRLTVYKLT